MSPQFEKMQGNVALEGEGAQNILADPKQEQPRGPALAPEIGKMYARWILDNLIEAAYAISKDYVRRYRHYRALKGPVIDTLASLRSRTGSDPLWPSATQRAAIYLPLFGQNVSKSGAEPSTFQEAATAVRSAATAYAQRVFDTGEGMLREAFVDAARSFKAYLTTLEGGVVEFGDTHTAPVFRACADVLASDDVARAFGVPAAPNAPWPIGHDHLDGNGAYLLEEIARTLQLASGPSSQQQFIVSQRVAAHGMSTIEGISDDFHLDVSEKAVNLRTLITNAHSWAVALRASNQ